MGQCTQKKTSTFSYSFVLCLVLYWYKFGRTAGGFPLLRMPMTFDAQIDETFGMTVYFCKYLFAYPKGCVHC